MLLLGPEETTFARSEVGGLLGGRYILRKWPDAAAPMIKSLNMERAIVDLRSALREGVSITVRRLTYQSNIVLASFSYPLNGLLFAGSVFRHVAPNPSWYILRQQRALSGSSAQSIPRRKNSHRRINALISPCRSPSKLESEQTSVSQKARVSQESS